MGPIASRGRLPAILVLTSLAAGATHAAPARSCRGRLPGAGLEDTPAIVAIFSDRREALATIEAARASAEHDLLAALAEVPIDEARVRSLTAEIVAFGDEAVSLEAATQERLGRVVGADPQLRHVRF